MGRTGTSMRALKTAWRGSADDRQGPRGGVSADRCDPRFKADLRRHRAGHRLFPTRSYLYGASGRIARVWRFKRLSRKGLRHASSSWATGSERLDDRFGNHRHVGAFAGAACSSGLSWWRIGRRGTFDPSRRIRQNQVRSDGTRSHGLSDGRAIDGRYGDHVLLAPPFILQDGHLDIIWSVWRVRRRSAGGDNEKRRYCLGEWLHGWVSLPFEYDKASFRKRSDFGHPTRKDTTLAGKSQNDAGLPLWRPMSRPS